MKKTIFFILIFSSILGYAQDSKSSGIPLIGQTAPSFKAVSTLGNINFPHDYYAKWKILFSHPADFTPVCTSEIIELAKLNDDLKKLNTAVIVISTDGINSHLAWVNNIEKMWYKNQVPVKIGFPLVSDDDFAISKMYGMLQPTFSDKNDIRGVFIIDPDNKVRALFFYPVTVGRNLEEIKRTLVALQLTDKEGFLTPANWKQGDDVLIKAPVSAQESEKMVMKNDPKLYNYDWFLWFKKQGTAE